VKNFWVITALFNPCKYESLVRNFLGFSDRLKAQGVNLLAVELAFGNDSHSLDGDVLRLRGDSVMWQKERLLNYAISQLPNTCEYVAWVDADILLPDGWVCQAVEKLGKSHIIQLYKKISYLQPTQREYTSERGIQSVQGVIWQKMIHKNWLERRRLKELPFSAPGFAWASRREVFSDIGIYDKNIVGSGDTFLVDCYLDSWDIHGYAQKFNEFMKKDMMEWCSEFRKKNCFYDYLPVDICHLYHGELKNRGYMSRHDIILSNNYDPKTDIELVNNVYEWASNKPALHNGIREYFFNRKEDQ
jgi:hypothetical protein